MNPVITSRQHPSIKLARALHAAKGRREHGLFLIEGANGVTAALDAGASLLQVLAAPSAEEKWQSQVLEAGAEMLLAAPELLAYASDSSNVPEIIAIAPLLVPQAELVDGLILILDGIGDPGNVGTLLRAADAMGVSQVAATEGSADFFSPKAVRASAGSLWSVPLSPLHRMTPTQASQVLTEAHVPIITAEAHGGSDCGTLQWPARCALVIGHETRGVSPELGSAAKIKVTIPIVGRAESLNAAMAGTLLLYSWRESLRRARA